MLSRLAILMLLAAVSGCDRPPQAAAPTPPPAPLTLAPPPSAQQIDDREWQCEKKARNAYMGDSLEGGAAEFESHYNVKRDTCFYLLTTARQAVISKKLLDIYENETYGEFQGAETGSPATCRLESLYCASLREWQVLAEPYMKD